MFNLPQSLPFILLRRIVAFEPFPFCMRMLNVKSMLPWYMPISNTTIGVLFTYILTSSGDTINSNNPPHSMPSSSWPSSHSLCPSHMLRCSTHFRPPSQAYAPSGHGPCEKCDHIYIYILNRVGNAIVKRTRSPIDCVAGAQFHLLVKSFVIYLKSYSSLFAMASKADTWFS